MENTNQPGLWTAGFGEIGATLKSLQDCGVTVNHLTRLRAEPGYAQRVASFIIRGGLAGEIKYRNAKVLLGNNFFGPEEWLAEYGFNLSQEQFDRINKFPWSEDVLNSPCFLVKGKTIKETHFAFLGMENANGKPLTILRWKGIYSPPHWPRFYSTDLGPEGKEESFAKKETCHLRWYLMPLMFLQNSVGKSYEALPEIIPPNYEMATAVEEVTKLLLYHRKTGLFLTPEGELTYYNRCRSASERKKGAHAMVGWFKTIEKPLLEVSRCWDSSTTSTYGIALSMKP